MTNKECVEHLKNLKVGIVFMNTLISDEADKDTIDLEALDLAIKALEAYDKILPLLNPDIDAELALEKIREVMYD